MLKSMRAAGVALAALAAVAAPALAQKPADRPATPVTGPDAAVIKEAVSAVKQGGECMVVFTVGLDGKPKDMKPTCTVEAYAPYVLRAMESAEYLPEIYAGEMFETENMKQPFRFGFTTTTTVAAAPGDKPPVKTKDVDPKELTRAMNRVDEAGTCQASYTVGADGKPKDIKPGCTPAAYDKPIGEALAKMRFTPGEKEGKPIDWPGLTFPLNLTKP